MIVIKSWSDMMTTCTEQRFYSDLIQCPAIGTGGAVCFDQESADSLFELFYSRGHKFG